jgi:hypothetical protein
MTIDIGFTGTRRGMTDHQYEGVHRLLSKGGIGFANHGDCLGADAQFHHICYELGIPVVIHPPADPKQRAFCEGAVVVEDPLPYLERDRVIVMRSALLIATPAESDRPRSTRGKGTWYTIDFAKQTGCDTLIIPPAPPERS